jgi:GMP synthase (glutamine-hydrolysing)
MRVLSVIHQADGPSGVFGHVVEEAGHDLVEWNVSAESRLPDEAFEAVLVFGGTMHVDQDERHGWLRDEDAFLRGLVAGDVPVLCVCLGGQLLAKALGASVRRMPSPQIGWHEIRLTSAAKDDPVFAGLPARFDSFQWHSYAFDLPPGAALLARDERCYQAFRVGATAWGLQFHAEVTPAVLRSWIESAERESADGSLDFDRLRAESEARIGHWNEIGREICGRFLTVAERGGATRTAATTRATTRGS